MLRRVIISFSQALQTIRTRFLHTLLSVLGIVIGVAALVGTLSVIDGLEKYGREQAMNTTSLQAVMVSSRPSTEINGVWVERKNFPVMDHKTFTALQHAMALAAHGKMMARRTCVVYFGGDSLAVTIIGQTYDSAMKPAIGSPLTVNDIAGASPVAVVSRKMALGLSAEPGRVIGKQIIVDDEVVTIKGILADADAPFSVAIVPIGVFRPEVLRDHPPTCVFVAHSIEDVKPLKVAISQWLGRRFGDPDAFTVVANQSRIEQAIRGVQIFRMVMSFVVGLTILVGGIGVMNVLLISVTERTPEIGIRKAVGARRLDIWLQFLSESITISVFGSLIGLCTGMLLSLAFIPVLNAFIPSPAPFEVAFTSNTLLIIAVVSVLVGILFGTYPATRASRLDPVIAIQRE